MLELFYLLDSSSGGLSRRACFKLDATSPIATSNETKTNNAESSPFNTNPMSISDYFAKKMNKAKSVAQQGQAEEVAEAKVEEQVECGESAGRVKRKKQKKQEPVQIVDQEIG